MNRLWKYISVFAFTAGTFCLSFTMFIDKNSTIFPILLALGVALLPGGLISIITALSSSKMIEDSLRAALNKTSEDLRSTIGHLKITSNYLSISKQLGVVMVYGNRNQSLRPFMKHLEEYVTRKKTNRHEKQIVFVGSSLKGVIEDDPTLATQLERILSLGKNECNFHFLLTHPQFSEFREIQEDRPAGGIAKEILHAIAWLEDRDIPRENIRLYKGTPTNFMISSTERMLINPYPYEREAYKCFCLELENNETEQSIFTSYWTNHYYRPWYGEQSRRDHYLKPNSLAYFHDLLDGPVPNGREFTIEANKAFTDFFVINDIGSFYMAVNIRGLESEVRYSVKGEKAYKLIEVGDNLIIKLLDIADGTSKWEEIGTLELSSGRDGFWQKTLIEIKALDAYTMIGVFDSKNESPFVFEDESLLHGQPMPLLWKELPPVSAMNIITKAPLLPFHHEGSKKS